MRLEKGDDKPVPSQNNSKKDKTSTESLETSDKTSSNFQESTWGAQFCCQQKRGSLEKNGVG